MSSAPALAAQQVLIFNVPMSGELTDRSPRTEGDGTPYADFTYHHQGANRDTVVLEVVSDDFDPYLQVSGPDGFMEQDDDGGRGLNPRIITSLAVGDYALRVSSLDVSGKFQVVVRPLTADDRRDTGDNGELFSLTYPVLPGAQDMSTATVDDLHPKNFAIVTERPRRSPGGAPTSAAVVFRPPTDGQPGRHREQAPETEVDRFSHIVIEWDRKYLLRLAASQNLALTVRARVESPTGARNAEVWSYSTIGQQRRTVGTAIRNLLGIGTSVNGLRQAIRDHLGAIKQSMEKGDTSGAAKRLQLASPDYTTYLVNLSKPDNGPGFKIVSNKQFIDPAVIADYSQALLLTLRRVGEPGIDPKLAGPLLSDFLTQIELLGPRLTQLAVVIAREQRLAPSGPIAAEQLTAQLKDGDLFVPETGARPGDRIIIEIENDASFDSIPRILKIPIRIVDFGLTQRTRDAFFFVTRIGASRGRSAEAIADSLDPVTASGVTTSVSEPLSVNFAPTPGITYGWSYYPRNVLGSRDLTGIVRWLHPGFGINVSFPRFGDRVVRFTQSDPATTSPAQVHVEESTAPINVAAGLVASVFDGAVQFTYGWNLSVDERRRYWGVGFSFIKLAGAIAGGVTE